jgi:hypothetical protein
VSSISDTPEIPSYIKKLPTYGQHPNGCGLASLLMLINAPAVEPIKEFLDQIWEKLDPLYGEIQYESVEYRWAIALQYILLKAVGYGDKDKIYKFYMDRLDYGFEDHRIINRFNQEQQRDLLIQKQKLAEAFTYLHYIEDHDYVTPFLLSRNLHTMKTDMELKILAELFNFQFQYQESEDGTGALYFLPGEIKDSLSKSGQKKWQTMEQWCQNPDNIILWGKEHHWLAVNGVYRENSKEVPDVTKNKEWKLGKLFINVNDPANAKRVVVKASLLNGNDRFYFFTKRPKTDFKIFKEFLKATEKDIIEEQKRWKKYEDQKREAQEYNAMMKKSSASKK